jgi:hypothetical protein
MLFFATTQLCEEDDDVEVFLRVVIFFLVMQLCKEDDNDAGAFPHCRCFFYLFYYSATTQRGQWHENIFALSLVFLLQHRRQRCGNVHVSSSFFLAAAQLHKEEEDNDIRAFPHRHCFFCHAKRTMTRECSHVIIVFFAAMQKTAMRECSHIIIIYFSFCSSTHITKMTTMTTTCSNILSSFVVLL